MKKMLSVVLVCVLLLALSQVSWAAIHQANSEFTNWSSIWELELKLFQPQKDKWFDTSKIQPAINVDALLLKVGDSDDIKALTLDYTKNEQTFANLIYATQSSSIEGFSGSYLFDFGLFAGVDYLQASSSDMADLSVGYRFNLGDQGFVSLSADYYRDQSSGTTSGMGGYEVDSIYYLNQAKLFGELYFPTEDGSLFGSTDPYIMVGANMALNDELTIGAKGEVWKSNSGILAGLTWAKDSWILNGKLGKDFLSQENFYAVNGSYKFTENWSIGASYGKYEDFDPGYAIKIAYKTGIMTFSFTWNKDFVQLMPE